MPTAENLKEAFAGESQANRTYTAFAKKAQADGLPNIARLFRAAAYAETVHALSHLSAIGGVKKTADNLQAAIAGEGMEFQEMYPKFVQEAENEGKKAAAMSFRNAMAVEEIHHGLYSEALKTLEAEGDLPDGTYYVCQVCGNTVKDSAPDVCPICGSPKKRFVEVK